MSALNLTLPFLLSSARSNLFSTHCVFQRKNMKLAGTEQTWLVPWIIKNGPWHWCLHVWHFRATWSKACHTDIVPWGEVTSKIPTLFLSFSLIPHSQGGSCVWRLSCLRYLCSLLFAITMLHLVSEVQQFSEEHLYSLEPNFWSENAVVMYASGVLHSTASWSEILYALFPS